MISITFDDDLVAKIILLFRCAFDMSYISFVLSKNTTDKLIYSIFGVSTLPSCSFYILLGKFYEIDLIRKANIQPLYFLSKLDDEIIWQIHKHKVLINFKPTSLTSDPTCLYLFDDFTVIISPIE